MKWLLYTTTSIMLLGLTLNFRRNFQHGDSFAPGECTGIQTVKSGPEDNNMAVDPDALRNTNTITINTNKSFIVFIL